MDSNMDELVVRETTRAHGLPAVLGCSPSSQWLRLRLVSVCPLREVFDLGVASFPVFSLAFLLSVRFAVTHELMDFHGYRGVQDSYRSKQCVHMLQQSNAVHTVFELLHENVISQREPRC